MGKRKSENLFSNRNKRYKANGFIDPNTSGVYATCNRGRELGCRKELVRLLTEKIENMYPDWKEQARDDDEKRERIKENDINEQNGKELSIEEKVKNELQEMQKYKDSKGHPLLVPMELGCECLVFVKTKKPVLSVDLVRSLCEEAYETKQKNTRFIQKLSPIETSVSASMEELEKMAVSVLKPHFHQDDQKPVKFAVQVTRRNFNSLEKEDIIKKIASLVSFDHGHSVDLKNYDKLIMVECYKTNVGMAVVSDFQKYDKFNLEQIFEKATGLQQSLVIPRVRSE